MKNHIVCYRSYQAFSPLFGGLGWVIANGASSINLFLCCFKHMDEYHFHPIR